MRLIDADAMTADLLTVDPQFEAMIHWCLTVLDAQPTVDAIEVIRCENCRHFDGDRFCDLINQAGWHDNDFCSYAERREDG